MNDRSLTIERLRRAFAVPTDDVACLVDELLTAALAHRMKINWHDGACEVLELGDDTSTSRIPVSKSVFLAVLARIAALCIPDSTSTTSYAGAGEISVGHDHRISVAYFNEPDREWLCLGPVIASSRAHSKEPAAAEISAK